jgi:GPH family glycoside/pentoside/hexuronide:cation symporter
MSHFIWNICWTANRNLIPVISDKQSDRSWLSARIAMGSNLGKLAGSYLVPPITTALFGAFAAGSTSGSVPVAAYTVAALIMALCFLAAYYTHYGITKGYDASVAGTKAVTFKDMGRAVATNDQLIVVLLHDALRLVGYYGLATLCTYYAKCVLGIPGATSYMLLFFYLGCIIGTMLTSRISARIGPKRTTFIGVLGWLVMQAVAFILPASTVAICADLFIGQMLFGTAYGLTSNLYAMCGTYGEWKTGGQARGVTMAFCSLAIKLGVAIRGVIIPAVLGAVGYVATAADPTVYSDGIHTLFSVMPVACLILSFVPLAFFKLDDERIAQMDKEIRERSA